MGATQVGSRVPGYYFEEQGNLTDARAHESGESRLDWSSHPHRGQGWKRKGVVSSRERTREIPCDSRSSQRLAEDRY